MTVQKLCDASRQPAMNWIHITPRVQNSLQCNNQHLSTRPPWKTILTHDILATSYPQHTREGTDMSVWLMCHTPGERKFFTHKFALRMIKNDSSSKETDLVRWGWPKYILCIYTIKQQTHIYKYSQSHIIHQHFVVMSVIIIRLC
jgi:hypothetical protein